MPNIIPFRAVRPTRDKVSLVASRSYQSYSKIERKIRLKGNPFSYLHIVNPGYKYDKIISGPKRFELVKNRYQEFKEDGVFIQDGSPCYYIYRIVNPDGQEFTGIIAAASVEDYKNNKLKRHEDTLAEREIVFKDYLKTVGFNAEPVLLTHPKSKVFAEVIAETTQYRAEYEFTTTYRDTHYLWLVNDPAKIETILQEFNKMDCLYIADGHHRSASSYLLAEDLKTKHPNQVGDEAYNYFMTYIIPEDELRISEFNRMVKDLNQLSKEEFLIRLDACFRVEHLGLTYQRPKKKGEFSMYLDGGFYSLQLRKSAYKVEATSAKLDAQILFEIILNPILGVKDPRDDQRLDYIQGKEGMAYVKEKIDHGEFKVGFGMLPVDVQEMKKIANEGRTMPPKTTYIQPKLRSGVTIYEF